MSETTPTITPEIIDGKPALFVAIHSKLASLHIEDDKLQSSTTSTVVVFSSFEKATAWVQTRTGELWDIMPAHVDLVDLV